MSSDFRNHFSCIKRCYGADPQGKIRQCFHKNAPKPKQNSGAKHLVILQPNDTFYSSFQHLLDCNSVKMYSGFIFHDIFNDFRECGAKFLVCINIQFYSTGVGFMLYVRGINFNCHRETNIMRYFQSRLKVLRRPFRSEWYAIRQQYLL